MSAILDRNMTFGAGRERPAAAETSTAAVA